MSLQRRLPRCVLTALPMAALGVLLLAPVAQAQPDPYDDPPAPPPKAQPKPPVPKPPMPKPPAAQPPAPKPPLGKPAGPKVPAPLPPVPKPGADAQPSLPPDGTAAPRPKFQPRPRKFRQPSEQNMRKLAGRPKSGVDKHGAHGKPGGDQSHAKKKQSPKDEHGYCIGHGPKDRPTAINLVHGWLGVNNEKAIPGPKRNSNAGWRFWEDSDWWKWQLTPYLWRYENHDDHCDPRNQPIPLLANIINLGALLFLFGRFGRKPLAEALRKRKQTIMSELDKARTIKKGAQDRLAHYEDELAHLDDTLVALRDKYVAEGELEEKRVMSGAGEARDRMLADVDFRLSQETKSARDDLSRAALDGALSSAEKLLGYKVTKADHDRLAEEYLSQIGPALKEQRGPRRGGGAA
ncbi:MAG: ATP synthase F0 subunit B [Deltaproteobacteria bacterium]|nr:ATP synthase F0 subunit B [Deltaproteobacteria bacterium]